MSNVRTQIGKVIGKSLNGYHSRVKPKIDELKFKEQYQGRIIDCMVGEVDDNYIETPLTDENVVKLEHSKEGVIKIPQIKGKTILIDAYGNETDTPGEGCRLVSVGEDEDNKLIILSKNKNLFDNSERVNCYYWSADNTETKHDNSYLSRTYIKVNQETYVTNGNTQVLEYDKNKNFIRRVQVTNVTYTPKENVGYIRLSYYNQGIDFKGQFELSNKSTTYTEPKQHKTEILLDEPLRRLSDTVYDEMVNNKIIRRVGSFKIDQRIIDNYYGLLYTNTENTCAMEINFDLLSETLGEKYYHYCTNNKSKCNIYTSVGDVYYADRVGYSWSRQYLRLSVEKSELTEFTQKKLLNKLMEKGFEVLYELKDPIIEELPNSITLQGFDDTTMYIENSITPTVSYGYNALIPYKEELLNQKEEVETNTLDIENNIIPYLMDMEYNLMLMEDN